MTPARPVDETVRQMDSRRERDLAKVAEDAYIFAYPLLVASRAVAHVNRLFVCPGAETFRLCGWLDLGREPAVLAVPEIRGRYYALWLRDAWNTAFASIGPRTTGCEARAFAVLGPGRHGERIRRSLGRIAAPTRLTRVTGCIEATDAPDPRSLGFRTASLSRWTGLPDGAPATVQESPPEPDDAAVASVERLDARGFFSEALRLSRDNPPEPSDRAALHALAAVAHGDRAALEQGARRARAAIRAAAALPAGELVGRWRVSYEPGRYGTDYLRRAAAARSGPATDPATDELPAVRDTDEDGRPLTGRDRYVLRFPVDASPPVNAFWSLTAGAGWIGDLHGLKLDPDGSLPIHIQHGAPEDVHGANWLPAPPDRFSVVLRLYWPREDALRRQWAPPAVTRVTSAVRSSRRPRR
jgi:hypothetical protein